MVILGCTVLAMAIFIIDLLIKNYIEKTGTEGEEKAVCGGRLLIRRYHNRGAFLNAGERRRDLVAVLSLVLTLGLTALFLLTFAPWQFQHKGCVKIGRKSGGKLLKT